MPLSGEADNNAATQEGDDKVDLASEDLQASVEFILPAVNKENAFNCTIYFCQGTFQLHIHCQPRCQAELDIAPFWCSGLDVGWHIL